MTSLAELKHEIALIQKAITPTDNRQHDTEYISSLLRCNDALINYSRAEHIGTAEEIDKAQRELNDAFTAHSKYNDGVFNT